MIDHTETLRRLAAEARAKGHEHMVLVVARPTTSRTRTSLGHVRIAPGLFWRWVGDLQDGRKGYLVDVSVEDVEAWLRRRGVTS